MIRKRDRMRGIYFISTNINVHLKSARCLVLGRQKTSSHAPCCEL